jgi:hypothetical protein
MLEFETAGASVNKVLFVDTSASLADAVVLISYVRSSDVGGRWQTVGFDSGVDLSWSCDTTI